METQSSSNYLRLGDIIYITTSDNSRLSNNSFLIIYIDNQHLHLQDINQFTTEKLLIDENNTIVGQNIVSIDIINRSDQDGYALQNGLVPDSKIAIAFDTQVDGESGNILHGTIVSLEKDVIEVFITTKTSSFTIYIPFDYKGIPLDSHILFIYLHDNSQPSPPKQTADPRPTIEPITTPLDIKTVDDAIDILEVEAEADADAVEEVDDDSSPVDIIFGDNQITVNQYQQVSEKKQRFDINIQLEDLLNELMAGVTYNYKGREKIKNARIMVERYHQMRSEFSKFNADGVIIGTNLKTHLNKPLASLYFSQFKNTVDWILPVVSHHAKLYNLDNPKKIEMDEKDDADEEKDYIKKNQTIDTQTFVSIRNNIISNRLSYYKLAEDLHTLMTPFSTEDVDDTYMFRRRSNDRVQVIVNNGDWHSSVYKDPFNTIDHKWTGAVYINGVTRTSNSKTRVSTQFVEPSDEMYIRSFLFLPKPIIYLSSKRHPQVSILDKSILDKTPIQLWNILKNATPKEIVIPIRNILDKNADSEEAYKEFAMSNPFLKTKSIINYTLSGTSIDHTPDEIYNLFVRHITPRVSSLFNFFLPPKYCTTFMSAIRALIPFYIHSRDITYSQYININRFISAHIGMNARQYSKNHRMFIELSKSFNKFNNNRYKKNAPPKLLFSVLSPNHKTIINDKYELNNETAQVTFSEQLRTMLMMDNLRLLSSIIAFQNSSFSVSDEYINQLKQIETSIPELIVNMSSSSKKCDVVIAKQYSSVELLMADNGKTIFFDEQYDTTDYSIYDEYRQYISENPTVTKADIVDKIKQKLASNKTKMDPTSLHYLALTIASQKKEVINGQYAVLIEDADELFDEFTFYKRNDKQWIKDTKLDKASVLMSNATLLVNVKNKHNTVDLSCVTNTQLMDDLRKKLILSILKEFPDISHTRNHKDQLKTNIEYNTKALAVKLNKEEVGVVVVAEDEETKKSPYSKLLAIILKNTDIGEQQNELVRFSNKYLREANSQLNEDPNWMYCVATSLQLIPRFRVELANQYLNTGIEGYYNQIESLKTISGAKSADESYWVDVNTGWNICLIDFGDDDFVKGGATAIEKRVTKAEEDDDVVANDDNAVVAVDDMLEIVTKPDQSDPTRASIHSIVTAITTQMGNIHIDNWMEFIMRRTVELIQKSSIQTQEVYDKSSKAKKTPYADYFFKRLLNYTVGVLFVVLQCNLSHLVPTNKVDKCNPSFDGYPLDQDSSHDAGIQYMSCIVASIKGWSVSPENITIAVNKAIGIPDIITKLNEKREHVAKEQHARENAPAVILEGFLPPLRPFSTRDPAIPSREFYKQLANDIKKGHSDQHAKINVLYGKQIQMSMHIISQINSKVKFKPSILLTASGNNYINNACCQDAYTADVYGFFKEDIQSTLNNIRKINQILQQIEHRHEPSICIGNNATMRQFPPILDAIRIQNKYMVFIKWCMMQQKNQTVGVECAQIQRLFSDNTSLSLIECVDQLVATNRVQVTDQMFQNALTNMATPVDIKNDAQHASPSQKMRRLLQIISNDTYKNKYVYGLDNVVRTAFVNILDQQSSSNDMSAFNDILYKHARENCNIVRNFIASHVTNRRDRDKIDKKIVNLFPYTFNQEDKMRKTQNDESKTLLFYKQFVDYITSIIPSMLINSRKRQPIPTHNKFTPAHSKKLISGLDKYYDMFAPFNNNESLRRLLAVIEQDTYYFRTIIRSIITSKQFMSYETSALLIEYYTATIMSIYCYIPSHLADFSLVSKSVFDYCNKDGCIAFNQEDTAQATSKIDPIELGNNVSDLMQLYVTIFNDHSAYSAMSYGSIKKMVFKQKEKEKYLFTDNLKNMSEDLRRVDTMNKILKIGKYSTGEQKGLTKLVGSFYDNEQKFRKTMETLDGRENAIDEEEVEDEMNVQEEEDEDYQDGLDGTEEDNAEYE